MICGASLICIMKFVVYPANLSLQNTNVPAFLCEPGQIGQCTENFGLGLWMNVVSRY